MAILTASKLSKSFGAEDIFWDVSVAIPHGAKIALVGPNGTGKTTLIRILIGLEPASGGAVHIARNTSIGYLPQEAEHAFEDRQQTVWDEMMAVFQDLRQQEAALRAMEGEMSRPDAPADLMDRYGAALERFELDGGYSYELETRQVLAGLGFSQADHQMPVAHLSGGQKTRALLAKLLLGRPQLLVLDEPTNHLDIQAIEWLEKHLVSWAGALLIVSHDRYFLDRVVNRIWELNFGEIETYRGNYSGYIEQRQQRIEQRLSEYKAQQAFITREEDFIRRNMAGQHTKEAQGRLKRLERLKRDMLLTRPLENHRLLMRFTAARRSGDIILQTKNLVVGYQPEAPCSGRRYSFPAHRVRGPDRTQRTGKTTFLRTILGQLSPLEGRVRHGASLDVAYFAQAHDDLDIDAGRTVIEELLAHYDLPVSEARNYLARFLFSGDDVFKLVSSLSGGERGRLALALLMRRHANFLLLDEPTNHLDIASQEVLENVLREFDGTILLVSHDRYLISRLATQIWRLETGRLRVYEEGYNEHLATREREAAAEAEAAQTVRQSQQDRPLLQQQNREKNLARRLARRSADLEQVIHALELRLSTLSSELTAAGAAQQFDRVRQLGLEYKAIEAELESHLAEWAEVAGE